jgi:hypothetical protein
VYGLADDDAKERKSPTITAPGPVLPFDGCVASGSLIAALLMNKYGDHLPLYRQESIFERYGLFITRRLSGEWTMRAAELLAPIVSLMFESLYTSSVFQLDDTPVRVQGGKGAKHFTGRFWVFGSPETSDVIFRFTRGRSAAGIVDDLRPMQGFLVGDGLQVNKSAAELAGAKVTICGCWAHALRKFRDAEKSEKAVASLFHSDITALFDIEKHATKNDYQPAERLRARRTLAPAILARLRARMDRWRERYSEASPLGKALTYLENQWEPLTRFLENGLVPIENNLCERAIRPIAVGRRNWLFIGSKRGGHAAAVLYSLIASCKGIGVDPEAYLADVLVRIRTTPQERLHELTPQGWKAMQIAAVPAESVVDAVA